MKNPVGGTGFQPVHLWRSLTTELARLNSARLNNKVLAKMSRREKAAAVKAALAAHHDRSTRCC
jgi:hypothetical protein